MFYQRKIEFPQNCPNCGKSMEWTGGKTDKTEQDYVCKPCRVWVNIKAMTADEQHEIAQEAFE